MFTVSKGTDMHGGILDELWIFHSAFVSHSDIIVIAFGCPSSQWLDLSLVSFDSISHAVG